MTLPTTDTGTAPARRTLYRIGATAALIASVVFRRNLGAEATLLSAQAPPVTAEDWFALLQSVPLLGLTFLGLFDVVNYLLVGVVYLALHAALRRVDRDWMAVAVALGLVGVAVYGATNQGFAMLALGEQYASAATAPRREALAAAGEALLAIQNPGVIHKGTGIYLSLLLVTLAGLVTSLVMLRSAAFGKLTAYLGTLAHLLVLGYFPTLILAPHLVWIPHTAAAVPLIVWQVLVARTLLRLARGIPARAVGEEGLV